MREARRVLDAIARNQLDHSAVDGCCQGATPTRYGSFFRWRGAASRFTSAANPSSPTPRRCSTATSPSSPRGVERSPFTSSSSPCEEDDGAAT